MGFVGAKATILRLVLTAYTCFINLPFSVATQSEPIALHYPVCHRPTLQDAFSFRYDQCSTNEPRSSGNVGGINSRVREMNGTMLDRALKSVQSSNDAYVVVLFYAKWCPFSQSLRPAFDTVSSLFPRIYHVAVEESAIRPSALSQYGVHSFPALFLHNKTLRIRYYGPRSFEGLCRFYKNIAGMQPLDLSGDGKEILGMGSNATEVRERRDIRSYSWVKSPEKLLQDDMYLTFATLFLVLRLLYYSLPKLFSRAKDYWGQERHIWQAYKAVSRRELLLRAGQKKHFTYTGSRSAKGKHTKIEASNDGNIIGRGSLSVPSWSSSSLAPMALAEGSSSRVVTSGEGYEGGR